MNIHRATVIVIAVVVVVVVVAVAVVDAARVVAFQYYVYTFSGVRQHNKRERTPIGFKVAQQAATMRLSV